MGATIDNSLPGLESGTKAQAAALHGPRVVRRTLLSFMLLSFMLLSFMLLFLVSATSQAAPSTFGPVIGSAVLCRSHLDNAYFYDYLSTAFGPSYKHEGGAYWFKADGMLWGTAVTDIMVSDDTSDIIFVGAVTEAAPDKLDEAIRAAVGVRHSATDKSTFPVRESRPGSKIVYFNTKSKVFCAKYKPLPILR